MPDSGNCKNCASLTEKCINLEEQIKDLNTKINRLLGAVFYNKEDVACQSSTLCRSTSSQTDFAQPYTNNLSDSVQSNSNQHLNLTLSNLSVHDSITQSNILFDIFKDTNGNQSSVVPDKSYAVPIVLLPYILIPNSPFSHFDFNQLDSDTVFDHKFSNRSTCYYGDQSYSYGYVKHASTPMPSPDNYLSKILTHLKSVLPDFVFNSVLLTRYSTGADCLGFHSDNEREIVTGTDIVTISLGESRVVKFKALSSSTDFPEQSLEVSHGDLFLMSRASQDIFQHSVVSDDSTQPRISITLRLLKQPSDDHSSKTTNLAPTSPSQSVPLVIVPHHPPSTSATNNKKETYTIYVGDSMFRHLDGTKMSSVSQKAVVFSYPGATSKSILTKLKDDPKFKNLDPTKVKNILVFCGTNDVDNILSIPRHFQSDIVKKGNFWSSEILINRVKVDYTKLVDFLHNWSCNADVNVLNILPRESIVRNEVINILNYHIVQSSQSKKYVNFVSTEKDRNLFSSQNGYRKSDFYSDWGTDNVHLNSYGLIRLAKHLKYYVHNK